MEAKTFPYIQEPEKSDLSCSGCCFNRELSKLIVKKGQTLGSTGSGQWACYSPPEEPFASCKKNHIIFVKKVTA